MSPLCSRGLFLLKVSSVPIPDENTFMEVTALSAEFLYLPLNDKNVIGMLHL